MDNKVERPPIFEQVLERSTETGRNIAFTAIGMATELDNMIAFFRDYARHIESSLVEKDLKDDPYEIAEANIAYVASMVGDQVYLRWKAVFEGLKHPYFGEGYLYLK